MKTDPDASKVWSEALWKAMRSPSIFGPAFFDDKQSLETRAWRALVADGKTGNYDHLDFDACRAAAIHGDMTSRVIMSMYEVELVKQRLIE